MEIHQLEYIVRVSECKSLVQAAASLGISQAALSKTIASANQEVGIPLFHRGHRLELTDAGRIYVDAAREILEVQRRTASLMQSFGNPEKLHITLALSPHMGTSAFARVYPIFHERYPDVTVEMTEGHFKDFMERVADGSVDMALGITDLAFLEQHPKIEAWQVLRSYWPVAIAEHHPYAAGGADAITEDMPWIPLTRLRDVPFIGMQKHTHGYELQTALAAGVGFVPLTVFSSANVELSLTMAKTYSGYTFAPPDYCISGLGLRYFITDPPYITTSCLYFREGLTREEPLDYLTYLMAQRIMLNDRRYSVAEVESEQLRELFKRFGGSGNV